MKLLIWIAFHISVYIETQSVMISYTVNNQLCMTSCVPYNNYQFCYLGWGANNWDYCTPGKIPSLQYYTTLYKDKLPKCTSLCGKFGYNYNWCFTGGSGSWDYCSDTPGISSIKFQNCVKKCARLPDTNYQCVTGIIEQPASIIIDNPFLTWDKESTDFCAPDPVNVTEIKDISSLIVGYPGKYTKTGYHPLEHCIRTKRISENVVRHVGVDELAARYERMYPSRNPSTQQVAVTSYTTMPAPPLSLQYDESLTLVVRATIYRRHLKNQREPIPNFITERMRNMNALPDDERGHLLAASLGGPTQQFNFVPQSSRVNRAYGGESYWYNIEGTIREFLRNDNTNSRYVTWTLVIGYGNLDESRRPTGFGLRFRQYDGNVLVSDSGNCYFTNGSTDECEII